MKIGVVLMWVVSDLYDGHDQLAAFTRLKAIGDKRNNLKVVVVHAGMLQSIQHWLLNVVHISATTIGWEDLKMNLQPSFQWTKPSQCQERTHAFAECSPLATDERPCSNPPPVMIDGRRVRQIELQFHDRFHGATLEAAAAAIGGAEDSFFA